MDEDEMERQMEEAIAKKYEALAKNKSPNAADDGKENILSTPGAERRLQLSNKHSLSDLS